MNLVKENLDYTVQCAEVRAKAICNLTMNYSDFEDYRQEIILHIIRHQSRYNPNKAQPKTFISVLASYGQKRILRKLNSKKNQIISKAIPITLKDSLKY